VHVIVRRILLNIITRFAERTNTDWDDVLIRRRVFHRLALFAPTILVFRLAPVVFQTSQAAEFLRGAAQIFMLVVAMLVVDALLNSVNDIYQQFPVSRRIPILGYLQVVKILVTVAVIIVAVSIVINQSPLILLSGLGALTAVILLIFKDSILGLVAGIQLVANDMVRPGDWIEMPKYGADGDVIEITLNTVKVQNWDKTITTIPTYSLISDSFKNWRGMSESGGRRIKRAVYIDVSSVRFCTPEMVEKFSRIQVLKEYIERKRIEMGEYNKKHNIDESVLVNGRRMTNLGTFRAYLVEYLKRHPKIHQEMTFLVRHLQPTELGLPIEIYVFSNDQAWANYEGIQADIFDHIFATLPEFGLRPFQNPTGSDIASLGDLARSSRQD
jgi:miniconductance mechanosensitive channel